MSKRCTRQNAAPTWRTSPAPSLLETTTTTDGGASTGPGSSASDTAGSEDSGGCACSAREQTGTGWLGIGLLALVGPRRRRARG